MDLLSRSWSSDPELYGSSFAVKPSFFCFTFPNSARVFIFHLICVMFVVLWVFSSYRVDSRKISLVSGPSWCAFYHWPITLFSLQGIPWFPSYTLNPKITTCTWVISLRSIISHYCRRVRSKSHQMSHHLPSQPQLIITCWYFLCVIKHPQIPPFFAVKVAVCSLGWIWRE